MIIISGPSTIGKNPFIYSACDKYDLDYIIPVTSRKSRKEEINGKDYHFLSKDMFLQKISSGEISHWDFALNNYYGYFSSFQGKCNGITHGLSRMALRIKHNNPQNIITVFFRPIQIDYISKKLELIYQQKDLFLRKELVEEELCHSVLFDYVFDVNATALELLDNKQLIQLLSSEKRGV